VLGMVRGVGTPRERGVSNMKISPFNVKTVDDCLDILEAAFQSDMWKQAPEQEKIRLVGRLSHILEITEKQELGE